MLAPDRTLTLSPTLTLVLNLRPHSQRALSPPIRYSGMLERNKKPVNIFPFNFIPMQQRIEAHKINYPEEE